LIVKTWKNLKIPKFLIDTFTVSLAATVATTPVAAWHFYHVMPYGILANLLITPSASFVIVSGFLAGILGMVAEPLATIPANVMYAVFKFYEAVCEFFAALPGAVVLTGRWPAVLVIAWLIPVVAAGVYLSGRAKKRPSVNMPGARFAGLLMLWLAAFSVLVFAYTLPKVPEVYKFEDGGCVVFRQGGEAIVFDDGADIRALRGYLDYRGVQRVAYFGLHDNLNRADAAIERIGNVYAVFVRPELAELRYYEARGIHFVEISPGYVLKKGAYEFYITDGFGVTLRVGKDEIEFR
jgi:hypothetical protein